MLPLWKQTFFAAAAVDENKKTTKRRSPAWFLWVDGESMYVHSHVYTRSENLNLKLSWRPFSDRLNQCKVKAEKQCRTLICAGQVTVHLAECFRYKAKLAHVNPSKPVRRASRSTQLCFCRQESPHVQVQYHDLLGLGSYLVCIWSGSKLKRDSVRSVCGDFHSSSSWYYLVLDLQTSPVTPRKTSVIR